VWIAHLMFELPVWQVSLNVRAARANGSPNAVATFGLLLTIFGCIARGGGRDAFAVGLYITSAYWFTASTSFRQPGRDHRALASDTFAGIAPSAAPGFILAQFAGMLAAVWLARWLWPPS